MGAPGHTGGTRRGPPGAGPEAAPPPPPLFFMQGPKHFLWVFFAITHSQRLTLLKGLS